MFELIFSDSYLKKEQKFFKKHKELLDRYKKVLHILSVNPNHPSLRLHKLQGNLKEYYSVSINMQYRVVINFIIEDGKIIFIDIGGHEVYK
jgi:addiction module RelE/StbE family toxin